MGLMDILQQYARTTAVPDGSVVHDHFDEVARAAPAETVGQGVADAFRADSTPSFGQMVGQMFGQSDSQQRAGVLNQLLRSLGPGVLSGLGGGIFGAQGYVTFSAETINDASREVHAQAIRELVTRDRNHPSVVMWSIANAALPSVFTSCGC